MLAIKSLATTAYDWATQFLASRQDRAKPVQQSHQVAPFDSIKAHEAIGRIMNGAHMSQWGDMVLDRGQLLIRKANGHGGYDHLLPSVDDLKGNLKSLSRWQKLETELVGMMDKLDLQQWGDLDRFGQRLLLRTSQSRPTSNQLQDHIQTLSQR